MSVFAIADLHLPGGAGEDKSMSVFENRWKGAAAKLEKNWRAAVGENDRVIIPGDVSWAMKLEETAEDFAFIDSLPGEKYVGKGNHDFWWTTARSMNAFFRSHGFNSIHLLYNNSYSFDGINVVGARGWFPDPSNQKTVGEVDWEKISRREESRLKLSLLSVPRDSRGQTVLFIHFPPVWNGFVCRGIIDLMHEAGIVRCYFGHIHGFYGPGADFEFEGISFKMISADRLNFTPLLIEK